VKASYIVSTARIQFGTDSKAHFINIFMTCECYVTKLATIM